MFAMIQEADTLGTFHIESSAQMSMLPQMNPLRFYDLVIQGAIVRPGPIQGAMVHQYLRRREGLEKPEYPRPELRAAGEDAGRVAVPGTGDESGEQRVEDMVGRGYSDES